MFKKNFYNGNLPEFNSLKKYVASLSKLRNMIMHFNFLDFQKEKILYIKTLRFWETLLNEDNAFIHTLPQIQPTIKNILKVIQNTAPDVYSGHDRILCDIFDDIAIMNNLPINNLPQYWSILRQKYLISKINAKSNTINKSIQKSLFFID